MADTYHFNKETGVHSLKFDLEMEANQARGAFSYIFDDGWGRSHIYAVRTGDTFVFSIKLDKDDERDYSAFKGCSVRIRDGQWLSYNTIKIWHNAVDTQYLATIHPYQFIARDKLFVIAFELSSMDVTVPPMGSMVLDPTLEDTILDKLYCDETHKDVLFIFDLPSHATTAAEGPNITSDIVFDPNMDARTSIEYLHPPRDEARELGKDARKPVEDKNHSKSDTSHARASGADAIGAHKLVLCQWPYFKAMFEGDFAEGGTGNKTIRIKDASPKAFRMLLRFMYTGRLVKDAKPKTVYIDPLNKDTDASWESLYLLAHRYDIQELVDFTREKILANLDPVESVPFLFRTAYLFVGLREPVIKYAAKSCGSTLASKSTRAKYLYHPESAELFGDLLEQMYTINK